MRCEGYRRYGGAFTLGPVKWEQCKEEAIIEITVKQKGEVRTFPACLTCWNEAVESGIHVIEVKSLNPNKMYKQDDDAFKHEGESQEEKFGR